MSPTKKRRPSLPTLINRGMGLLEVVLPRGIPDDQESALPPGKRDPGGFWFPASYGDPSEIFSPTQRRMQATQRRIQKQRRSGTADPAARSGEPGGEPAGAADPGGKHTGEPSPERSLTGDEDDEESPGDADLPRGRVDPTTGSLASSGGDDLVKSGG